MDANNVINQEIKRKFIDSNVLACQTSLINELLSQEMVNFDPPAMYYCSSLNYGTFEGNYAELQAKIEELNESMSELEGLMNNDRDPGPEELSRLMAEVQSDLDDLDQCEPTYGEPMEWWLVNSWLADKLEHEDEIIINEYNCHWWGRQTSGQAIYMDGVISRICQDLEMLC